jgi:hypothetical protein
MRSVTTGLSAFAVFLVAASSAAGQPPRQEAGEIADNLVPHVVLAPVSENELAGLSMGSHPPILTWDRIYSLALIRARTRRGAFSPALDPEALAEEAARQGVADFSRFRTNFHSDGPFRDPGPTVLELEGRLLAIDNARRNIAVHEGLNTLIVERSRGSTSGVSRIDVDTVFASLVRARQKLVDETRQFRDGLDQLKFLLGLSPRAPVILDRQNLQPFPVVFDTVEDWARAVKRRTDELTMIIDRLPVLGEIVLNGEPILERIEKIPDQWEVVLAAAAQLAFKSRSQRDEVLTQPNSGIQLELQVRRRIRELYDKMLAFRSEKRCYELAIRLKDQAFERLVAPAPPSPVVTSRSSLVSAVIEQETRIVQAQDRLIWLWTSFRAERLALYHDLGVLPYQDWKSFYADLSAAPVVALPGVPVVAPRQAAAVNDPQPPVPPAPPRP